MNKCICILLFLYSACAMWGQTIVSGKITAYGQPIKGATVKELDENNRIVSQSITDASGFYNMPLSNPRHALSVRVKGYREHIERLFGRNRVDISLIKDTLRVPEELLMGKHKKRESYKLLYGHNGARNVSQLVRIEMLNDTLFTLTVPIQSANLSESYPANRSLMFVDATDNQLLVCYNAQEVFTIAGEPYDTDNDNVIARKYIGIDYTPNSSVSNTPLFVYPQFIFSIHELSRLLEQEDKIHRLLIDTARGDNFWILYPAKTFGNEIRKMIAKLTKNKSML